MKKLMLFILILSALSFGTTALAYAGDYIGDMEVVNCDDYVSMREYPDTDSERILKISLGSVVEDCYVYDDDFIHGEFDMQYGYILSEYLEPCSGVKTFDRLQVVGSDEYVLLFSQPDTESRRLLKVPLGAMVENCVIHDDDFTYAEYDGRCGFILSEYLEEEKTNEHLYGWEYFGDLRVYGCDSWVSLYEEMDTDSRRILKIPLGAVIEDCYINSCDFVYGEYQGKQGYVLEKYLIEAEYIGYSEVEYMQVSNTDSWVSLRQAATVASERLAKAPKDAIVEVLGEESGFYHVIWDGLQGYIHMDYLEYVTVPYADADDQLTNSRIRLHAEEAAFGVYLISDSMGGDWSVLEERHHLDAVLNGMPEEWWPVVMTIPEERIIEIIGGTELYLIIPTEEDADVTVNRMQLGYDGTTGLVEEVIYQSDSGEPILLRCNAFEAVQDCGITVEDMYGANVTWYPTKEMGKEWVYTGAEGGYCLDFTVYD